MGTYRLRLGRGATLSIFGVMAVASVVLVVSSGATVASGEEDVATVAPFLVLWLAAFAWNAYCWLLRIAHRVTVADGTLSWEAPLRRGAFALSDLVALRPMRFVPNVVVLEPRVGRKVILLPTKGLAGLAAAITAARPDADVRLGAVSRAQERIPGPSAWHP